MGRINVSMPKLEAQILNFFKTHKFYRSYSVAKHSRIALWEELFEEALAYFSLKFRNPKVHTERKFFFLISCYNRNRIFKLKLLLGARSSFQLSIIARAWDFCLQIPSWCFLEERSCSRSQVKWALIWFFSWSSFYGPHSFF